MSIEVLSPGLLTTVQGHGREGFRHLGVGLGGALDPDTQAIANLLVGNAKFAPTLEIALAGPTLRFEHATRIALCGAAFQPCACFHRKCAIPQRLSPRFPATVLKFLA